MAVCLPLLINLISAYLVSKSETVIVVIKVLLLILIIVASVPFLDMQRLSVSRWDSNFSILVAGMIIFVAYEGFELISNSAEDIKIPKKTCRRHFIVRFYWLLLFIY